MFMTYFALIGRRHIELSRVVVNCRCDANISIGLNVFRTRVQFGLVHVL